jgi:IclR family KDG regulon transcriptional repressor
LDLDSLWNDLEQVKKRGYALDLQERMQGVCCVAAPVRDADGKLIAALSVSSRLSEFLEKGEETLAHAVIYHANRISSTRGNQNGYI